VPSGNIGWITKRGLSDSDVPFAIGMAQNTLKARVVVNDGTLKYADTVNEMSLNEWNFIVGTITSGGKMKIYLNGQFESEVDVGTPGLNNYTYKIGGNSEGNSLINYFNGYIDEIKYYNRPLNDDEIQSLYHEFDCLKMASPWGIDGETRRQPIYIVNNNMQELTYYQVEVNIPYDSDMQADFDDIRFVHQDGVTPLNYYLESKTDSVSAKFWVRVPRLPVGLTMVYVYYGNDSLVSASNGDSTFILFDDFNSGVLNTTKWNYSGTIGFLDGRVSDDVRGAYIQSKTFFDVPFAVDMSLKVNNPGYEAYSSGGYPHIYNASGSYVAGFGWYAEGSYDRYVAIGGGSRVWANGSNRGLVAGIMRNSWSVFADKQIHETSGVRNFKDVLGTGSSGYVRFFAKATTSSYIGDVDIDWVFVRKTSSVDLSVTKGEEEVVE
jgi:hypothetical protein